MMQLSEHIHADESVILTLASLIKAASAAQTVEKTTHLIVPLEYKHIDITAAIEKAQPNPNRKIGTATLNDIESFNKYALSQGAAATTVIYADPEARTLTAVFNEHAFPANPLAGWRDYRAVFKADLSREFSIWLNNNKQPKEQEDFAIFLEDNIADVVEPSGESLLAIALTLQAKTAVNFESSRRLDNGQVQIAYTETIEARAGTGSIEIPREFSIGCRLFKNGDGYKIKARLKYRLGGGKVKFWYELDRPDNAVEDAFKAYVQKAGETGFTVLVGKP